MNGRLNSWIRLNLQLPHNPGLRFQRQASDLHSSQNLRRSQRLHINLDEFLEIGCNESAIRRIGNLPNRIGCPLPHIFADLVFSQMSDTTV